MKIKVIASTKVGYNLPKEEAIDFSGKSAGICYLPDTIDTLFAENLLLEVPAVHCFRNMRK